MKLSRALTAIVLVASISATGVMVAHAGTPASGPLGLERRALRGAASIESSRLAGTGAAAPGTLNAHGSRPAPPKRVIVRFKSTPTKSVLSATARSADTSAGTVRNLSHGAVTWRVPPGRSAEKFAADLEASGKVEYAVPDYERQLVAYTPPAYVTPNDEYYIDAQTDYAYYTDGTVAAKYPFALSWWLRAVHAADAWQQAYTGADIVGKYPLRADVASFTVAVIDSGLYVHPDNQANVVGGRDFFDHEDYDGGLVQDNDVTPVPTDAVIQVNDEPSRVLTTSHGTCVSGEIGATANNGIGTIGVGYDTRVIVHKVMGTTAGGRAAIEDSAIYNAIIYSVDHDHAKVINMSLGGYENSPAIANAINYAYAHGCVIVAAKGNDNSNLPFYPASNAHVISVGALDNNANGSIIPAYYTNYAKTSLDIMAPGTFVVGFSKPDYAIPAGDGTFPYGYYIWDGTSMAAPVVSGAFAWLWRAAPALTNAEIMSEVLNSAPIGPKSTRFPAGYRRLDMNATYARLKSDFPLLTKPVVPEMTVASLDASVPITWTMQLTKLRGVTYHVWSDSNQLPDTTGKRVVVHDLAPGDHTFAVRASSSYNWDDETAFTETTIHVMPSAEGTATWQGAHVAGSSATVATPAYHVSTTMDAKLLDASSTALSGAVVRLQSSTDGSHFADVPGVVAANLQGGDYRSAAAPTSRRWYRFSFAGKYGVLRSVSSAVRIVPGVSLTTPYSKSTIWHTSKLSVSGKLMPSHASSSRTVKIKIKRWNGTKWADYSWVWARVTRQNSSYATYAVKLSLKKGGYRLYAYAPADTQHAATTSGYRAVRVK
jgi:hypothetical protein